MRPLQPEDWTEPGAHEVADGIFRVPLPLPQDGLRAVNVYVLVTPDGLTCIDGGWAVEAGRAALESSLAGIGASLGDIRRFLVTHVHRDHYTQAVAVRREFGPSVLLGIGERRALDLLNQEVLGDTLLDRQRLSGVLDTWAEPGADVRELDGRLSDDETTLSTRKLWWEYPDDWIQDGATFSVGDGRLTAVATPGHTQGHVVFADEQRGLLFAGDHVLPTITPSIGFEAVSGPLPLGDFLASLAKVRRLPDMRLLAAHGPVAESSHARVDELVRHHDERLARCRDLVGAEQVTAFAVATGLPWTRRLRSFAALDDFNRVLAAMETMAHLDLLAARGELARIVVDGIARYSTVQPVASG